MPEEAARGIDSDRNENEKLMRDYGDPIENEV